MNCVRELIVANPAGYLDEYCEIIRRHLGKTISPSTMYRVIKRLGLSRKKLRIIALQRCAEKEILFCVALRGMFPYQFIFLDETHVDNRCRNRLWGWSKVGERVSQKGFYLRGTKYSCLASINVEGIQAVQTVKGGFNGEKFMFFVKHLLVRCVHRIAAKNTPVPDAILRHHYGQCQHSSHLGSAADD